MFTTNVVRKADTQIEKSSSSSRSMYLTGLSQVTYIISHMSNIFSQPTTIITVIITIITIITMIIAVIACNNSWDGKEKHEYRNH